MKYIIMAAGAGTRWNNYLGVPKHLIEINGEPLLARTARLLKENNITDYVITCSDPRYAQYGPTIPQTDHDCEIDRFEESVIDGPVCYLYGDVYYSEDAMKTIINESNGNILFFGSHQEIFAIKVENIDLFLQYKHKVKKLFLSKVIDRCIGWEIYKTMHNMPWRGIQIGDDYIRITDETDDIDYPSDYEYYKNKIEKKKNNWLKNCISIIIPCYNNAENTKKIIDNLLEQKKLYPETEIIIVENGSTEDMSFLDEYDKDLVIVLHETIKGPSHARNAGIKKARGEYIAFIDNDDDIAPNYVHLLYQRMRFNNSEYDYCIIPALVDGNYITDYDKIDMSNPLTKLIGVWHYCFNRRIIQNIYFDETIRIGEDIDWLNKIIPNNNNGTIIENNTPIYYYKWANNEQSLCHRFNRGEISKEIKGE